MFFCSLFGPLAGLLTRPPGCSFFELLGGSCSAAGGKSRFYERVPFTSAASSPLHFSRRGYNEHVPVVNHGPAARGLHEAILHWLLLFPHDQTTLLVFDWAGVGAEAKSSFCVSCGRSNDCRLVILLAGLIEIVGRSPASCATRFGCLRLIFGSCTLTEVLALLAGPETDRL